MKNLKPISKNKTSELIYVKTSNIHNKGVFAKKNIPKKTEIIDYTGKKVLIKDSNHLEERDEINGTVYLFELDNKHYIDGADGGSDSIYIIHSCDPNCEPLNDGERIWIQSIKDIKANEELFYDYGFDADIAKDHKCLCGSTNCCGYIVNSDQIKELKILLKKDLKNK